MDGLENTPKIEIRDLNVFAGKNQILKNVNIDIPRNKVTEVERPRC